MTLKTLRDQLVSDPNFRVNYIVANNPGAVEDKLRAMGFSISGVDDIWESLRELLEQQRTDELEEALTVPILTDDVDAAELAVVADVAKANLQAADPDGVLRPMKSMVQGPWSDGPMGPTSEGGTNGGGSTNDGGGSFWNTQAASGLLQGLFGLGAGFMSSQGLYQVPTTNEAPDPKRGSGLSTVLVILAILVLLAVVAFIFWKRSK